MYCNYSFLSVKSVTVEACIAISFKDLCLHNHDFSMLYFIQIIHNDW